MSTAWYWAADPDEFRRFQRIITVESYQLFLMTPSYVTQDLGGLVTCLKFIMNKCNNCLIEDFPS